MELYKINTQNFDSMCKSKVWSQIAIEFKNIRNKSFTANQCTGKWKGLKSMYKKIKYHNNTSGNSSKNWEYYDEMDEILHKRPEINPPATCSSDSSTIQINSEVSSDTFDFDDIIVSESSTPIPSTSRPKKRKLDEVMAARERNHREKMERADKFLDLFQTLVTHITKK